MSKKKKIIIVTVVIIGLLVVLAVASPNSRDSFNKGYNQGLEK